MSAASKKAAFFSLDLLFNVPVSFTWRIVDIFVNETNAEGKIMKTLKIITTLVLIGSLTHAAQANLKNKSHIVEYSNPSTGTLNRFMIDFFSKNSNTEPNFKRMASTILHEINDFNIEPKATFEKKIVKAHKPSGSIDLIRMPTIVMLYPSNAEKIALCL